MTEEPERFGLSWPGKRESLGSLRLPARGALVADGDGSAAVSHLLIEGDNLEVLKLLRPAYAGAFTLIYLDPPYNTGNDFVYDDDFADGLARYLQLSGQLDETGHRVAAASETSGRWHSRWLSMMLPRLILARDLLAAEGVVYVSIDDNEVAHLRLLLDEVFGADNFVAQIAVSLNPKGRQLGRYFATSHEYLLVYARDLDSCALSAASTENVSQSDFPKYDEQRGLRYRLLPLRNTNKKFNPATAPTMHFAVHGDPGSGQVRTEPFTGSVEIRPVFGDGTPAVWRWSRPKIDAQPDDLLCRVVRGQDGERADVFQKDWLTEGRTKKLKTVWSADEAGTTDHAVAELKERVGHVFETPKPLKLMRRILATMPADALVLDPFAGSGTMGEAVVAANAEDGGNRRFVCVNLPAPVPEDSAARAAGYASVADIMKARLESVAEVRRYRLAPSAFADPDSLDERTLVVEWSEALAEGRIETPTGREASQSRTSRADAAVGGDLDTRSARTSRPALDQRTASVSGAGPDQRAASVWAGLGQRIAAEVLPVVECADGGGVYRDAVWPLRDLDQRIAAEVLLREGVRLDAAWEWLDLAGVSTVLAGGVCVMLTTELDDSHIEAALALEPRVLVLLEDAFVDGDSLRLHALAQAERAGVTLKTV
ncbi:MAG: site-specific DNA-methyltransferase [Nocardioidaceae bacterium]